MAIYITYLKNDSYYHNDIISKIESVYIAKLVCC